MPKYPAVTTTTTSRRKMNTYQFDSLTHIVDLAMDSGAGKTSTGIRVADTYSANYGTRSWSNYSTAAKVSKMLDSAQTKLIAAVDEIRERIEKIIDVPKTKSRKRKYRLESGDEISAIDYIQRNIDGWSDIVRTAKPKPVIRIGIDVVTMGCLGPEVLIYRGAAVVVLTDILSQMGHGVEVICFWSTIGTDTHHPNNRETLSVTIKSSDTPMNINSVIVALAEIAFSRVVMMPAMARSLPGPTDMVMGIVVDMSKEEQGQFDVFFNSDCLSLDAAVDVVRTSIAKAQA